MQNLKSNTPRQETRPFQVNITTQQYQALTKMYNMSKLQTKNANRELIQQPFQQQQLIYTTITPRNNTPQSCKRTTDVQYFQYQKNNCKEQIQIYNDSQVFQKQKYSLHHNISEKGKCATPIPCSKIQSQEKSKIYNPLSIDQKFTLNQQIVKQFTSQIIKNGDSQINKNEDQQKKDNLKVSLDDFITQINQPSKCLTSPFKQTKSLSPTNRFQQQSKQKSNFFYQYSQLLILFFFSQLLFQNKIKQQLLIIYIYIIDYQFPLIYLEQLYYVTSLVEAFKYQYPQTLEQQLFKDHAIQTYNCIGFCLNLKDPDPLVLRQKEINVPFKQYCKFQKTVVFDLDETLIHCNENQSLKADVYLPIKFPSGELVSAGINIRPYAKWILRELSEICEVIVFTASHECYASQVISHLDPNNQLISAKVFRDSCIISLEGVHIKDLRIFKRDLKDIVLVDNAAYSFGTHLENGIPIIPFYDSQDDKELKLLYDFLVEQVLPAPDSRLVLQSFFKLREFSKYREPKIAIDKLF